MERSFPWVSANNGNDASITEIAIAIQKICKDPSQQDNVKRRIV
jgi:hypothetical protein